MLKCLSCSRTDDDIGKCGSHLTCPNEGAEIDPKKTVVIRCELCDITRAIHVDTLTKRRDPRLETTCPVTDCAAFVVRPPTHSAAPILRDEPEPAPAKKPSHKAKPQVPPAQD